MRFAAKSWLLTAVFWLAVSGSLFAAEQIHIGIQAYRPKPLTIEKWRPLKPALEQAIPGYEFNIDVYTVDELQAQVASRKLDFILTNPSQFLTLYHRYGLSAPLLSLSNLEQGYPVASFGGVIFTRSERADIQALKDLRNKSVAVVSTTAFGSFQMQAYELQQIGIKLPEDLNFVITGQPQDNVVDAVVNGAADVGFVRTGVLENLSQAGKLDFGKIKILNSQNLPGFPVKTSTRLYPEWVLASLPHTDKDLKRKLVAYLLTLEDDNALTQKLGIHGFDVPQDYTSVEKVLRELKLPPFDMAYNFTFADVWHRYRWLILLGIITAALILLLSMRLLIANRRLNDSQNKLQAVFNSSEIGIAWAGETGAIEYANAKFVAMFGYTLEEVPSIEDWFRLAYPDPTYRMQVATQWNQHIAQSLPAKVPLEPIEVQVHCKDDARRDIMIYGSWAGDRLMAMFTDITERKQAQESLAKQERHLRAILETTSECVKLVSHDGILLAINAAGLRLLEAETLQSIINKSIYPFISPDSLNDFLVFNLEICNGNSGHLQYQIVGTKGTQRWVEARAVPFQLDDSDEIALLAFTQDITERKEAEAKLRLTSRVFECALEGIMITDANRDLIEVNDAFCQITGYSREEVIGKNPRILKSGHHDEAFYKSMWEVIKSAGHWSGEIWNRRKDGEVYPEWMTISTITSDKGEITHYVGISSDITLLKQHEKQLEHIAHYDALTGIPNRVLLGDRIQQAMAHTRREHKHLAICYLDLDGFKPINDRLGHESGDQVLIKIAERINRSLRGGDTVARLGGDEFVILLLGIENIDGCYVSLERLLQAIQQPISIKGQLQQVTASIGVTLYPQDDEDPDTLLRHADQAMYIAKQSGKNRYYIFDPSHDARIKINRELRLRIDQGLENGEFELFYQPKVSLSDNRVIGAEALIRWQHPDKGLLSPIEFLPMIENTELEIKVGEWVIETAVRQIDTWRQHGRDLEVSINIAATHLQSPSFIKHLSLTLAKYSLVKSSQLQIEILETAALADVTKVSEIINACSAMGVEFALDDFGTGYSSLAYLRRLPAKTLKIDQSFVRDMLTDRSDYAIVQGIIALAQTFQRTTIAEGVETEAHFKVLMSMGCDIAQGYGIARPMSAEAFLNWLEVRKN